MPPRKPLAQLEASGSIRKNPQLYRDRREPAAPPVGPPPNDLPGDVLHAWNLLVSEIPWVKKSDRALLHIAATLRARLISGEASNTDISTLIRTLSLMGATPADRSRILADKEKDDDDLFT